MEQFWFLSFLASVSDFCALSRLEDKEVMTAAGIKDQFNSCIRPFKASTLVLPKHVEFRQSNSKKIGPQMAEIRLVCVHFRVAQTDFNMVLIILSQ